MKRRSYISLIITGALILCGIGAGTGCSEAYSGQPRLAVAEVAGESIDAETFRTRYVDYLFKTGLQDASEHRLRVLNSLVDEYLLVQDARRAGIERDPRYQAAVSRHRTKFLIESFVKEALFDTLQISEDELKDMFIRAQTTLTARHLYASSLEGANRLYERLQNGETFEALAREVFADTALANNGGFLGEFTLDDMDLAFEEAAYALAVGEISQPVKTGKGYSIIKVENRFTKPLITEYEYAERRDRMEHFVSYRKKTAARIAYVRRLMQEMKPAYEVDTVEKLLDQIRGLPAGGEGGEADWLDAPLVTYALQGKTHTLHVADFRELAALTTEEQRATVTDRRRLEEFVNGLLVRKAMLDAAIRMGLEETPRFQRALDAANRAWIRDDVATATLRHAEIPEDSLQHFFQLHRESFTLPATVQLSEILLDSKKEADALRPRLTAASFATLARQYSLRPGAAETGGDLGYLTAEQTGAMYAHVKEAAAGEIRGPIELRGHYVFLRVGDRRPPRPLTYEEARPEVLVQMQRSLGKKNLQDRIRNLRAQHDISIDRALLSTLPLKKEQ